MGLSTESQLHSHDFLLLQLNVISFILQKLL